MVSFVIKYSDKSNLREKGFVLAHRFRFAVYCCGLSDSNMNVKHIVTLYPVRRK